MGARIVGVSFDSVEDNAEFAAAEGFQYELWSDLGRELALHYGAASEVSQSNADRITVVLDEEGTWILSYDVGFEFGTSPATVLADLQAIYD